MYILTRCLVFICLSCLFALFFLRNLYICLVLNVLLAYIWVRCNIYFVFNISASLHVPTSPFNSSSSRIAIPCTMIYWTVTTSQLLHQSSLGSNGFAYILHRAMFFVFFFYFLMVLFGIHTCIGSGTSCTQCVHGLKYFWIQIWDNMFVSSVDVVWCTLYIYIYKR